MTFINSNQFDIIPPNAGHLDKGSIKMLHKGATYVVEQHLLRRFFYPGQLVDALDGEMVSAQTEFELVPTGTRVLCLRVIEDKGLMIILDHQDEAKLARQVFVISENRAELFLRYLPSQGSF